MKEKQNLCMADIGGIYEVCGMELPRKVQMRLTALGMAAAR